MHAFGRGQGFVQSSITFRPRQYPRLTTAAVSGGAFAYLRLRDATNGPYSTSARGRMLTGSHWWLKTQRPSLPRQPPKDAVCSSLFATAALFEAIRQGRRFSTWPAALLLLIQPRRRRAVTLRPSGCLALNKSIAQARRIMGRGTHANYVALSDRDLPRLQTANDAIAASGRFRRYGPVRLDVCLQKMWGDHHPHNQNREVKSSPRRREAADRAQGDRGKARVTERAMLPPPIRRCSENTPAVN
jgi:hypothetical protein